MTLFRLNSLIAAGGSLALLLGAFAFQHIGGLAPCHLCLLQRWPHAAAILIGAAALALGNRLLGWLGAAAGLTTEGITRGLSVDGGKARPPAPPAARPACRRTISSTRSSTRR